MLEWILTCSSVVPVWQVAHLVAGCGIHGRTCVANPKGKKDRKVAAGDMTTSTQQSGRHNKRREA